MVTSGSKKQHERLSTREQTLCKCLIESLLLFFISQNKSHGQVQNQCGSGPPKHKYRTLMPANWHLCLQKLFYSGDSKLENIFAFMNFLTFSISTWYFTPFQGLAKQISVSQYFFVGLISLIKDKHFFIHLIAIHTFPSMNRLFVCHLFFYGISCVFLTYSRSSLCIK